MTAKVGRGSKPGERRGGRKKGTPNKTTAEVKAALTAAFMGIGGVAQLQKWAKEHETEFYKLWAKLLPTEVVGDSKAPLVLRIEYVEADD